MTTRISRTSNISLLLCCWLSLLPQLITSFSINTMRSTTFTKTPINNSKRRQQCASRTTAKETTQLNMALANYNNIDIQCIKNDVIDETGEMYSRFVINNLQAGQGITIGNVMRRVLLGDLNGLVVSSVRIAGIKHEFTTIPGVREDILEILLNLKGIVLKNKQDDVSLSDMQKDKSKLRGYLKVQGPAVVTAGQIETNPDIEIINKNHYIATISTSSIIEAEFKFEYGTGYKLSNQAFADDDDDDIEAEYEEGPDGQRRRKDEGFLQLDCVFMPVRKVNFEIETIYGNNKDSYSEITERLFLDVWTNGSISPRKAVLEGCNLLTGILGILGKINDTDGITLPPAGGSSATGVGAVVPSIASVKDELGMVSASGSSKKREDATASEIVQAMEPSTTTGTIDIEPYTNIAIEELKLSVRSYNCLKKSGINTVGDLLRYSPEELLELKNFGQKSADNVFETLKDKYGIVLK